jgi:hypothetical protein
MKRTLIAFAIVLTGCSSEGHAKSDAEQRSFEAFAREIAATEGTAWKYMEKIDRMYDTASRYLFTRSIGPLGETPLAELKVGCFDRHLAVLIDAPSIKSSAPELRVTYRFDKERPVEDVWPRGKSYTLIGNPLSRDQFFERLAVADEVLFRVGQASGGSTSILLDVSFDVKGFFKAFERLRIGECADPLR